MERTIDRVLFSLMNNDPATELREIVTSPELLAYLDKNGVAGVFFYVLKKALCQDLLPTKLYDDLQQRFHLQIARNLACAAAARKVFQLLYRKEIPFLVLKGLALAENTYPHFAMRTTSDLDILIHREDLPRADQILAQEGYHAQDSTVLQALCTPPGYLASLEYHKPDIYFSYIHLHWHLVNTSTPATGFIENIDMERIWKQSRMGNVAEVEVQLLGPEHLVIYLCEHGLRVGHSFDRLNLICDLFYAVKSLGNQLDWDLTPREAKKMGLKNFVCLGLKILQTYGGKKILPDAILEKFDPRELSLGERLFLHLQQHGFRLRGSSYLVYLAANRSFFYKGHLIFRTLFPPRLILAQRVRQESGLNSSSLYVSRIAEISALLLKMIRLLAHYPGSAFRR